MKTISIIGLGWLGIQLAEKLSQSGFKVVGTTTTEGKLSQLLQTVDQVKIFDIEHPDSLNQQDESLVFGADLIILTIPPSKIENYGEKMIELVKNIKQRNPKVQMIYTGSSSVYGDEVGEVDEQTPLNPQSSNAKKIAELEEYFQKLNHDGIAVLRLGGLVGPGRHPVKYLIGRSNVKGKNKAVNLIHSADIAEVVLKICKGEYPPGVYNLCCPEHPLKSDYYIELAKRLNQIPPNFNKFDNQLGKIVICKKLSQQNYQFIYSSPFQFPLTDEI